MTDFLHTEGWDVFHTTGTQDIGNLRIERRDEDAVFASDYEVWAHVLTRANEGSEDHLMALLRVFENNPTERQEIIEFAREADIQVPLIALPVGEADYVIH